MTLIVSSRIPDGIVIAGDSLSTMMGNLQAQVQVGVKCPKCNHEHTVEASLAPISMPATTFSYAQKIFPFLGKCGIGTFGNGQVLGKTIYFAAKEFELSLDHEEKNKINSVSDVADKIGEKFHEMMEIQLRNEGEEIEKMPNNYSPLGFQIVGYDIDQAKTIEIKVGKKITKKVHEKAGVTVSGSNRMVKMLFEMQDKNPTEKPVYEIFSLQDAIEYSEFLINMTASQQQFSRTIPKVGGQIDIGLVTPFDGFKWIKRKELQAE